eukprot:6410403-Prymnesium_polylepis.1
MQAHSRLNGETRRYEAQSSVRGKCAMRTHRVGELALLAHRATLVCPMPLLSRGSRRRRRHACSLTQRGSVAPRSEPPRTTKSSLQKR